MPPELQGGQEALPALFLGIVSINCGSVYLLPKPDISCRFLCPCNPSVTPSFSMRRWSFVITKTNVDALKSLNGSEFRQFR